jgi:hypothetical protein
MASRPARRLPARAWVYVPAACSSIGGGLIKLGHGSTWAAVATGMAPYALCALLLTVHALCHLSALIRYLCAKPEEQQAMERLITVSANAIVSILTLTAATIPGPARQSADATTAVHRSPARDCEHRRTTRKPADSATAARGATPP